MLSVLMVGGFGPTRFDVFAGHRGFGPRFGFWTQVLDPLGPKLFALVRGQVWGFGPTDPVGGFCTSIEKKKSQSTYLIEWVQNLKRS